MIRSWRNVKFNVFFCNCGVLEVFIGWVLIFVLVCVWNIYKIENCNWQSVKETSTRLKFGQKPDNGSSNQWENPNTEAGFRWPFIKNVYYSLKMDVTLISKTDEWVKNNIDKYNINYDQMLLTSDICLTVAGLII